MEQAPLKEDVWNDNLQKDLLAQYHNGLFT